MKRLLLAALLLALSPAALAQSQAQPQPQVQVSGSDEEVYAMFTAGLEKCKAAVPAGEPEYAKVRKSLAQLMQRNPQLAAVLKSPTLKKTLAEARTAVDGYIARNGKEIVCDELQRGIFGPIAIPVGP